MLGWLNDIAFFTSVYGWLVFFGWLKAFDYTRPFYGKGWPLFFFLNFISFTGMWLSWDSLIGESLEEQGEIFTFSFILAVAWMITLLVRFPLSFWDKESKYGPAVSLFADLFEKGKEPAIKNRRSAPAQKSKKSG